MNVSDAAHIHPGPDDRDAANDAAKDYGATNDNDGGTGANGRLPDTDGYGHG
ncbi:hypothetical protein [Streptomyces sediminimaris]|uniref:hypothetical protein n=1 Tax=Streptomyces sediminimaris TaxID=3383721 RepID=UPI003999A6EF